MSADYPRFENLSYEVAAHVARITISRPAKLNALSWQAMSELRSALAAAKADPDVRVVILAGAGDRAFCAGADLSDVAAQRPISEFHRTGGLLTGVFTDLWELGKPTIARVQGLALGGGMGVALACDLVVASEDAQFGLPEVTVGVWPMLVTVPLVRSMPAKKALELMLTGRLVGAEEAERLGFVTRIAARDELDATLAELAAALSSRSPVLMSLGRTSFYQTIDMSAADALPLLQALITVITYTRDFTEGMAAFRDKRAPKWTGL
jgi:enoyl-CoA hydratase/carnithine racemase